MVSAWQYVDTCRSGAISLKYGDAISKINITKTITETPKYRNKIANIAKFPEWNI